MNWLTNFKDRAFQVRAAFWGVRDDMIVKEARTYSDDLRRPALAAVRELIEALENGLRQARVIEQALDIEEKKDAA